MFASNAKAIASVLAGLVFVANNLWGLDFDMPEGTYAAVAAMVVAGLTWVVPNR